MSNYSLDSPKTILSHKDKIVSNYFLHKLYIRYYQDILNRARRKKLIVELGSGGGFIKEIKKSIITSDVVPGPDIDKTFSAGGMPFKSNSVDAFVMLNVFHHIPNTEKALTEMQRCLKSKGRIVMIEPYNTFWSRLVYKNFHHERFDNYAGWGFKGKKRLTDSNMALPWIVFVRDKALFEQKFPDLRLISIEPHSPFSYILSGGLSKPQLAPNFAYKWVMLFERLISPLNRYLAIYATFVIEKVDI